MAKKCKMVNPVYIESPRDWQTYVFSTCYFRPPCLFPNKVMRRPINAFRHGVWKPVEENSDVMNIVMRRVYFKREVGKWRQKPLEEWTPKRKSLDVSRLSRRFSKCVSNDEFELWIERANEKTQNGRELGTPSNNFLFGKITFLSVPWKDFLQPSVAPQSVK